VNHFCDLCNLVLVHLNPVRPQRTRCRRLASARAPHNLDNVRPDLQPSEGQRVRGERQSVSSFVRVRLGTSGTKQRNRQKEHHGQTREKGAHHHFPRAVKVVPCRRLKLWRLCGEDFQDVAVNLVSSAVTIEVCEWRVLDRLRLIRSHPKRVPECSGGDVCDFNARVTVDMQHVASVWRARGRRYTPAQCLQ
jgi:hypothetical protein